MQTCFRWTNGFLVFFVISAFVSIPAQADECGRLCDAEFWKVATPADVQAELAKGSDLQARDGNGFTPLHMAAVLNGKPTVVSSLLKAGAVLETRTEFGGSTPLHLAAASNANPAVVNALLAAGATIEARNKNDETPLYAAVNNENPAVVRALLVAGAALDVRDKEGWTPLHVAVRNENAVVVSVLLAAGANLEARIKKGWTPLHFAARG